MKEQNNKLLKLGLKVKKYRNKLGLSQEKLAFICEFDRTYISLVERGKRNISYLNLVKLSKGLKLSISELTKDIE